MDLQKSPPNSFHSFPRLPPEIRIAIWRLSITSEPRLIPCAPIAGLCVNQESRAVYLEVYELCFLTLPNLPRYYQGQEKPWDFERAGEAASEENEGPYQALCPFPFSHYANFSKDILLIDGSMRHFWYSPWKVHGEELQYVGDYSLKTDWYMSPSACKIRHLAITEDWWELSDDDRIFADEFAIGHRMILDYPNLKTITLLPIENPSWTSKVQRDNWALIKTVVSPGNELRGQIGRNFALLQTFEDFFRRTLAIRHREGNLTLLIHHLQIKELLTRRSDWSPPEIVIGEISQEGRSWMYEGENISSLEPVFVSPIIH